MKRVFIIHGWEGSPKEPLHKWLKKKLEEKRFDVVVPEMPDTDKPKIKPWVSKIKEIAINPDKNTYFIGHSIGCQAVLRYLETLDNNIKIGGVIFIAPWMHLDKQTIEEESEEVIEIVRPWVDTPIDWVKVKSHTDKFVCILSDNDPYVPLTNKELFKEKLSAKVIIEKNKGHFDESSKIKELPIALKELLRISKI